MKFNAGRLTSKLWMGAVFVFLYLPILTLIILSFQEILLLTYQLEYIEGMVAMSVKILVSWDK